MWETGPGGNPVAEDYRHYRQHQLSRKDPYDSPGAGAVSRITDAARTALCEAMQRKATLLSLWPGLDLVGAWEKLLMPMLHFIVFALYPAPLALTRRDPSLGIAHGACMLAHRETYLRVGGHEAVRDEIFEDTRLARTWREQLLSREIEAA